MALGGYLGSGKFLGVLFWIDVERLVGLREVRHLHDSLALDDENKLSVIYFWQSIFKIENKMNSKKKSDYN